MSKPEMISVIIPVYNVELYLDRCVQSVVSQTHNELEIILVDDGSTDNCPTICDAWGQKDSRIKVIHKPNGGLSDARNAGMAAASGDYIAFVDSDDWIAPEMLKRLIQTMKKDSSDIAACSVRMVWEDDRPDRMLTVRTNCVLDRQEAQRALLEEKLLKHPVWYKLYKRETIQNIPFEKGKYHEDVFWSYQVIGNAARISLIDYIGYFYTQRSASIMGAAYSQKRLDAIEAHERWYCYLEDRFPELRAEACLCLWEKCIYHGQMVLRCLSQKEQGEAFAKIDQVIKKHNLKWPDFSAKPMKRKIWLVMAKVSLRLTCRIKNAIGIGM